MTLGIGNSGEPADTTAKPAQNNEIIIANTTAPMKTQMISPNSEKRRGSVMRDHSVVGSLVNKSCHGFGMATAGVGV